MADLQKKVEELTAANEQWKARARDISKQMSEVTILQQKYEKRKAKTAALKVRNKKIIIAIIGGKYIYIYIYIYI